MPHDVEDGPAEEIASGRQTAQRRRRLRPTNYLESASALTTLGVALLFIGSVAFEWAAYSEIGIGYMRLARITDHVNNTLLALPFFIILAFLSFLMTGFFRLIFDRRGKTPSPPDSSKVERFLFFIIGALATIIVPYMTGSLNSMQFAIQSIAYGLIFVPTMFFIWLSIRHLRLLWAFCHFMSLCLMFGVAFGKYTFAVDEMRHIGMEPSSQLSMTDKSRAVGRIVRYYTDGILFVARGTDYFTYYPWSRIESVSTANPRYTVTPLCWLGGFNCAEPVDPVGER